MRVFVTEAGHEVVGTTRSPEYPSWRQGFREALG
jgi:hypothetical protein